MVSDAVWELHHPVSGLVGEVLWVRVLRRPALTVDRLVAGLNGPSTAPCKELGPWRLRPVEGQVRFELWYHREPTAPRVVVGEIGWHHPLTNGRWLAEAAVAGLNGRYTRLEVDVEARRRAGVSS
jgi:hypothetical protein